MNASLPIISPMKQLTRSITPSGVVLIGAGTSLAFLSELPDTACLIVEADPVKFKALQEMAARMPKWQVCNELISKDAGIIDFYETTLSSENSIIPPEQLKELWPNLETLKITQKPSITLHELIKARTPVINWLFIDCLPALPIIDSLMDSLDDIDLIKARVIITKPDIKTKCAHLQPLQEFLEDNGFCMESIEISRHPDLAHALFIRQECADKLNAAQELERLNPSIAKESIDDPALKYYQKLARKHKGTEPPPFVLIDSKSLPRSGLHYLKNTFAKLLGDQFSFCEWYQEIGCCKKHPCSIFAYADHAVKNDRFRLRLKKSHDLEHTDPPIPPSKVLQRLVLIRDPLFILTSWFELDQLNRYRSALLKNGLDIRKIWLMHEKELQIPAYQILASVFDPPTTDECRAWLQEKARYIIQFTNDWVTPAHKKPNPYCRVIQYEEIDQYLVDVITPYRKYLSKDSISVLDNFANRKNDKFVNRLDPYSLHAKPLETYVRDNAFLFEEIVEQITQETAQLKNKNRTCMPQTKRM